MRVVLVVVAVALLSAVALFRAEIPSPHAYREEFTRLTGLPLADADALLEHSATFPNWRGQYRACFVARLAPAALADLQARLGQGSPARLKGCRLGGAPLAATAWELAALHEDARIEIVIAPQAGLLQARWFIRKPLKRQ